MVPTKVTASLEAENLVLREQVIESPRHRLGDLGQFLHRGERATELLGGFASGSESGPYFLAGLSRDGLEFL
jgi:hypothetical protein